MRVVMPMDKDAPPGGGCRLRAAAASLLCLLLLVCGAPARADAAQGLEPVRLQLKWRHQFQFAGYYAAQDKGFFRQEGLEVTFLEGRPGIVPTDMLNRGDAQFAVDSSAVLMRRQAGQSLVVCAAIYQHSPVALLALNASGIVQPADLRGKRVVIDPKIDVELMAMLSKAGLRPGDFTAVPRDGGASMLLSGRTDALSGYLTSEALLADSRGQRPHAMTPAQYGIDFYGDCLVTTEAFARERPELVERFLRASLKGWRYAMANPREIAQLILSRYSQDKPLDGLLLEAEAMRPLILPDLVEIGHMNADRWRGIAGLFEAVGMLEPGFKVEEMLFATIRHNEVERRHRLLTSGAVLLGAVLLLGFGAACGLVLSNRRLAERVRSRTQALAESEAKFRILVEHQQDLLLRCDAEGRVLYVSPSYCRVFGKTEAELLGQPIMPLVHTDDLPTTMEAMRNLANPPHSDTVVLRNWTAEGLRWYSWTGTGILAPDGTLAEVLAVGRDVTERRQAEEALRESERRFHSLFDNMAEGVALHLLERDRDGKPVDYRILDVNPSYCRILGLDREAAVQLSARDAYGAGEAPYLDIYAEVAESGRPYRFETYYEAMDRHFDISVTPWEQDGFATIFSDVSDRKRAEQALLDKTEELERYFQNTLDLLCIADLDGFFRRLNPQWESVLGYSLAELEGRRFLDLVHPDDHAATLAVMQDLLAEKMVTGFVNRYRTKDGDYRFIEWRSIPVGSLIYASARDITGRRQAEEALRESEAQYRGIFEQAAVGITHCNLEGLFLRANPKMTEIVGYTEAELLGMTFQDITHPEDLVADMQQVQGLLDGQSEGYSIEKRYIRKDGGVIWAHLSVRLVSDTAGGPRYFIAVIEDITERKMAMIDMEKARVLAEDANRSKSEFLANMSHEIRTPLNGVLGMLQLLRGTPMDVEQGSYVDKAHDAARRLLTLLSDILDFSKIEAGKLSLRVEAFSLSEVFDSVTSVLGGTAMKKGVALRLDIDESVPEHLLGDDTRIRQVLLNLVGNSVKFTPAGSVQVRAWAREMPGNGRVLLYVSVTDTGVGIPEDKLSSVFDRFTQSDGSYSRQYEGAGLGLTIVRRIVDLMDGDICVESEVGLGTTMLFSLPLGRASTAMHQQRRRVETAAPPPEVEPLRILLAEDETISQFAMRVLLQRMGHSVMAVGNGRAAVEEFKAGTYDAILMDIQMPEMNGLTATRVIREDKGLGELAQIPIIALTAYALEGDREKFLAAGMTDYVTKPVSQGELQRALGKVRRRGD